MTPQEIKEQLYYECCSSYYHFVSVINYIAYAETLTAIDMLDDEGQLKQQTKHLSKRLERAWKAYEGKVRNVMDEQNRKELWLNFIIQVHRQAEQQLLYIRIAIKNKLDKERMPHSKVLAQLFLSVLLTRQACTVYDMFFDRWKERSGYDFSTSFRNGRLTEIASLVAQIEQCVTKQYGIKQVFSFRDSTILNSYAAYLNAVTSNQILEDAAGTAIDLTPSVAKEAEKVRQEIEEERAKQAEEEKAETIKKLSDKFIVRI